MTSAKGGLFWPFMNRINRIHRINRMCSGRSACHERDFLELLRTASLLRSALYSRLLHRLPTGSQPFAGDFSCWGGPRWRPGVRGCGLQCGREHGVELVGRQGSYRTRDGHIPSARPAPPLPALAWWLAAPGPCFALHCTI